jgi:hypothetical protein
MRPVSWPKHGFGTWLARAAQRLHPNVLAAALANATVAMANKTARTIWAIMTRGEIYRAGHQPVLAA